jgi:hypothetical protein
MPNEKEFRQIADRNGLCAGKALDGEKRLVLLGCQAGSMGGRLAERQKFPKLIAKLSERLVIDGTRYLGLGSPFARSDRRLPRLLPFQLKHPALPIFD